MTEEEMPDVAPALDRRDEGRGIEQRDVVHAPEPHLERRMVHDDHHRAVARLVELGLQPGAAGGAEAAPWLAGLIGVKADAQHALAHLERVLDEAVAIDWRLREYCAETGAVVVVADDQVTG